MKQMNGLKQPRPEILPGDYGYSFVKPTPEERERIALFVEFRLIGFSATWAAFWAFRHEDGKGVKENRRWIKFFAEKSRSLYHMDNCNLLPPGFMDMLESV
jgi:hypothetical protein